VAAGKPLRWFLGVLVVSFVVVMTFNANSDGGDGIRRGKGMSELEWGAPTAGWRLSASLDKEKFIVGELVLVTLVTRNVSNRTNKIQVRSRWITYDFEVRDEHGPVRATRFGEQIEGNRGMGSMGEPEFSPGETVTIELPLSRLFDLSLVGKYTVRASRMVYGSDGKELRLQSNTASFEIMEE